MIAGSMGVVLIETVPILSRMLDRLATQTEMNCDNFCGDVTN